MAIFLLDTAVIVDALNGRCGHERFLGELLDQHNLLACCSIHVTEVYAGMRPREAKATEALLKSLKFYEVTWEIARHAGELKNRWAKNGHTIALPDVTVAAVAMANGLTLVTGNRRDFPMPELRLLQFPDDPAKE